MLDSAKMGIIAGSLIAGISGYLVLRSGKPNQPAIDNTTAGREENLI
jgi:hypothetical protein